MERRAVRAVLRLLTPASDPACSRAPGTSKLVRMIAEPEPAMTDPDPLPPFDAVVIGRNEGGRLAACLRAVLREARQVVYVDSGSTDGSPVTASALGAEVIDLDPAQPFTAARGRNAGFQALAATPLGRAHHVQFIDGDCVMEPGWPQQALRFLALNPDAGLVFGRQYEKHPDASIFNRMTDWEWDKPLGDQVFCAGCLMVRAEALDAINGYRAGMIAGEDDDMCMRMQAAGWQTWRIEGAMTEHDARLLSFGAWWRRMVRAGHSFAELGRLHGAHGAGAATRRQRTRALVWAVVLPVLAVVGAALWWPLVALIAALYAASLARQTWRFRQRGFGPGDACKAAALLLASKFATVQGMATYHFRRLRGQGPRLIEYR